MCENSSPNLSLPPTLNIDIENTEKKEIQKKLYEIFYTDFFSSPPSLQGEVFPPPWSDPKLDDKESIFWHLVSDEEPPRGPDSPLCEERCKRLPWIKPIIEAFPHPAIGRYQETVQTKRGPRKRENLFLMLSKSEGYLIIIEKRRDLYCLISAYPIFKKHRIKKQLKKCPTYQQPRPLL